jgi:hypothetical protein
MLRLTLSHYTLNGQRVHDVLVGGCASGFCPSPNLEAAVAYLQRCIASAPGKVEVMEWDGDAGVQTAYAA